MLIDYLYLHTTGFTIHYGGTTKWITFIDKVVLAGRPLYTIFLGIPKRPILKKIEILGGIHCVFTIDEFNAPWVAEVKIRRIL